MDEARFDRITQHLAAGTSRRAALRLLALLPVGALLSLGNDEDAEAGKRSGGRQGGKQHGFNRANGRHRRGKSVSPKKKRTKTTSIDPAPSGGGTPPVSPTCGKDGGVCTKNANCCEGFSCEGTTCAPNICAHTCLAADNFCNVPPANQCCGGKKGCRCMTTNSGPFCFGGGGYGGCEGTTAKGKVVPHCETNAECETVFGADSGVQCIAASTFPAGSSCCPGGNQSACILPCTED